MDRMKRSYLRLLAKDDFREKKRQEFQAWIGKIFELGFLADYDSIRLTQGDGGLDGIILSELAAVAVYAPREMTASELQRKIAADFSKAMKTFADRGVVIKKFILIHNDEGLTKDVGTLVLKLNQDHLSVAIEIWRFERLWMLLEKLTEDQLDELLGAAPTTANMERLEMPAIRDVVQYLTTIQLTPPPLSDIEIPNAKKLEYNRLGEYIQHILRAGRVKQKLVQQYLEGATDMTTGEKIAEGFRQKYVACRDSGMEPDDIFETLWELAGGNHFTTPTQHAAVTAVLSHFFHFCDIFENAPPPI